MNSSLRPKPLFASSTVRGATLTAIVAVLSGVIPPTRALAIRNFCPETNNSTANVSSMASGKCVDNIDNIIEIVTIVFSALGLGGSATAVYGRVAVGDLWTPRGIPGPNREDFMAEEEAPLPFPPRPKVPTRNEFPHNNEIFDDPQEGLQ